MKLVALMLLLLAPAAYAHPLDDKAQMTSEVVIISDQRLEYVLHFRYVDSAASYAEISGGLDGNNDGVVTAPELKRRFNVLVDELTFALTISVDRDPITLEPDFERFLFQDMTRVGDLDLGDGVNVENIRIHYRFVFWWDAGKPLAPGDHVVEYSFNGLQTVVHTPVEQMVAFDARKQPRERMTDVSHNSVGIPKLTFHWNVAHSPVEPPPGNTQPLPGNQHQPAYPIHPDVVPVNYPAWLTLVTGVLLAIGGLVSTIRRTLRDRKGVLTSALVVVAGLAIVLGALARLGYFDPFG
jgi:hypothetical protein